MALLQGIKQVGVGMDSHIGSHTQPLYVGAIGNGIVDTHCFVRAPSRQHLREFAVCSLAVNRFVRMIMNRYVVLKGVGRVVGRADDFHIVTPHQSPSRELRLLKLLVALVEYLSCSLGI